MERKIVMLTKRLRISILLLLALSAMLLAACSASTNSEYEFSDLNVYVRETPEPGELDPRGLLAVHFIDVGEGDAILIVQGDYAMLIDGGSPEMGQTVLGYLRSHGIGRLSYVVATHPFEDHVGGLGNVLQQISVDNVLLPMVYHDTPVYNGFLAAVEASGADAAVPFAGHTFTLGDAEITVLSPEPSAQWENRANYSIVMKVAFGTTSFMLPGDAMREVEAILLDGTAHLSSDVLKVARHGASSATTSGFLDAVNPSIAVISTTGGENSFLSQEVIRRLNNAGIPMFRTDVHGNIVITSNGTALKISVERQQ
jgi:competence protein ComEC